MPRAGQKLIEELKGDGTEDVRQIPEGYLVSNSHERVRRVRVSSQRKIQPEAGEYLGSLPYPRFYLDFETIQFADPIWAGTRP